MINLLSFAIPIFLSFIMYFSTYSLLFSAVIFIVSFLYFLIHFRVGLNLYLLKKQRYNEMNQFINSFVVAINVKKSLLSAFEISTSNCDDSFKKLIAGISELTEMEKLIYLERYFPYRNYKIFVKLMQIWEEQGVDIINLTSSLLSDLKNEIDYLDYSTNKFLKRGIETSSLWLIAFCVLIVLRFALTNFYSSISNQLIFQLGVFVMILIFLFSVFMLITKLKKVDIQGWNNEIKRI